MREELLGRGEALVAALTEAESGSLNWKKQCSRSGLRFEGAVQVTVNGTVPPSRATEIRARPPLTVTGVPGEVPVVTPMESFSSPKISKVALLSSWLSIVIERVAGTEGVIVPSCTRWTPAGLVEVLEPGEGEAAAVVRGCTSIIR
jgi:hypothetical protein